MDNVATYSEARSEYTKQLATFIVPTLVGWFQQLWSRNSSDKLRCLALFQTECEEIARWNIDRVQDEVRVLIERTGCDYMEELMTAVFIAHTKILTAVRMSTKQKKLSIHIPKLDQFVHRIFKETARSFWKSPFLFMENGNVIDRQKNILQIEAMAAEAITTAVRSLLPVKQILQDYLESDQDEVEEDVPESVPEPLHVEEPLPSKPIIEESLPTEPLQSTPIIEESLPTEPLQSKPIVEVQKEESTSDISASPAVLNIDTEPVVRFSSYDDVYDESYGAPEFRNTPKDEDDDDLEDLPSDGALVINEESAVGLSDTDAEDLEAPVANPTLEKVIRDTIDDNDVEVLE